MGELGGRFQSRDFLSVLRGIGSAVASASSAVRGVSMSQHQIAVVAQKTSNAASPGRKEMQCCTSTEAEVDAEGESRKKLEGLGNYKGGK